MNKEHLKVFLIDLEELRKRLHIDFEKIFDDDTTPVHLYNLYYNLDFGSKEDISRFMNVMRRQRWEEHPLLTYLQLKCMSI